MKKQRYEVPEAKELAVQCESILSDSNEGDWMPLNLVIPDNSSVE